MTNIRYDEERPGTKLTNGKKDHLSPGPLSLGAVSCVVGVHLAFLTTRSQAVGGVHLQKRDLDES